MSEKFSRKWSERNKRTPFTIRIRETVRPPGPLKKRLVFAIRRIEIQIQTLDKATDRFSERDKSIFSRIVDAVSKHDMPRANVFANELAEIRKMERMMIHARLALEQIALRLSTVSELGDIVTTLAPAVDVMSSIRNGMAKVFPEAEREFGDIGNLLNGIIMDAGNSTGLKVDFQEASEGAQKILNEASTVAEQKVKEKFPGLPAGMLTLGETTKTETKVS